MNIRGENKDLHFYNKEGIKIYEYRTYSDGDWRDWRECTYNEKGDLSTCKYSAGDWHEYTYNKNGKVLTYKDSNGIKRGFNIPEYTMEDLVEKLGNFKLIK